MLMLVMMAAGAHGNVRSAVVIHHRVGTGLRVLVLMSKSRGDGTKQNRSCYDSKLKLEFHVNSLHRT